VGRVSDPDRRQLGGQNRRLAKDFENLAETQATFVTSIQLALRPPARTYVVNSTSYWLTMRDDEGRKSDGEGTFAGTRGNDEYAPFSAVPRDRRITGSFHQTDIRNPTTGCSPFIFGDGYY
jgi:hypothetical protein